MRGEQNAQGVTAPTPVVATEVLSSYQFSPLIPERTASDLLWKGPYRKAVSLFGSGVMLAGAAYLAAGGLEGGAANVLDSNVAAAAAGPLPGGVTNHENCDNLVVSESSFPGHPGQIVPSTESVTSADEAGSYNRGLFAKGNQGTNLDPTAAATFYALMGYPATNSGTDNESDVHSVFGQAYNQMVGSNISAQDEKKAAENFCNINESVTSQTYGYDSTAIAKNVPYTQISGVVGSDGHNNDIALKQFTNHSDTIGGVTYKLQNGNTASKYNGFLEVIIPNNGHGTIDVLGLLPNNGTKNQQQNQGPSGQQENSQNNGASTTEVTSPTNGGSNGPGGSSPTEKQGNAGGAGTAAEGTQSGQSGTGSGGSGGGGGGTPPTTVETPPPTTPPTQPPQTTTTTSPPTTTTTFNKPPVPTTVPAMGGN